MVDKHTAGKEEKKEKKEKKDKKEKKEKKQHKGHHKHRHHKTEDASESVESTSEAGGEERGVKGHESEEERRSGWSKVKAHLPSMKVCLSFAFALASAYCDLFVVFRHLYGCSLTHIISYLLCCLFVWRALSLIEVP